MSQTIRRATEILICISEAPRTLSELAEHFEVHRSTVLRQLQPLEESGFLLRRSDGHYTIGPRIISMAQESLDKMDLRAIAHEELRGLQERVGSTVHLAQLIENSVMYVDKVEDTGGVRMYSRIGKLVRVNCTGVGKVILSRLSVARRDEILRHVDWTKHTANTLADRAALDAELKLIERRGWGVDDGEFEDFTNCVAAPVSNATGTILGAISITSIRVVRDLDALTEHVDDLLATARRISRQLS